MAGDERFVRHAQVIGLGADVGGTHSRIAAVDDAAQVIHSIRIATPHDADGSALCDWIAASVAELVDRCCGLDPELAVRALGVAVPGIIDPSRRRVVRSLNLPFLRVGELADRIERIACRAVALTTDAEACALGEYHALADKPAAFAHLRLGTGVACGLVIAGQPQLPPRTGEGHVDVLVVESGNDAPPCPCGRRGCLESIAGGRSLERAGSWTSLPSLEQAVSKNDEAARAVIDRAAKGILVAVQHLGTQLAVEVVVLGGGVFEHLPSLAGAVNRLEALRGESSAAPRTLWAQLGDLAGVVGAAKLATIAVAPS